MRSRFRGLLGARSLGTELPASIARALRQATDYLRTSRPTAVNLFWALDRMDAAMASINLHDGAAILDRLLSEARQIEDEDRAMCRAIGRNGAALVEPAVHLTRGFRAPLRPRRLRHEGF